MLLLQERFAHGDPRRRRDPQRRSGRSACRCALLGAVLLSTGCRAIPVYEQQHVSKSGMQFSETAIWQTQSATFSQLETGLAFSGGAQPTTCSACK